MITARTGKGIHYRLVLVMAFILAFYSGAVLSLDTSIQQPVQHPVASIPLKAEGYDLAPYLLLWHDQSGQTSFEEAMAVFKRGQFRLLEDSSPNIGFREGYAWFYLGLNNPFNYKRLILLEVDYAVLDQVEVYCFGPEQVPVYYPSGDHVQYDSRPLKVRNFVFPLAVEPFQQLSCMLRVRSTTNILLPIRAYDNLSYIEQSHVSERYLGAMYGVALALLVYNLIQFALTRQVVFLYFSLHVVGGVAYMSFMDGTLAPLWISLEVQDVGIPIAMCLGIGSALLFSDEFLALKADSPMLHRITRALLYGVILLFIVSLFGPLRLLHMLVSAATLIVSGFLLVAGLRRWLDRYEPAKVYMLGFGAVFVTVIWIVLNVFFLKADVRWITYGVNLVWMLELIVLSVAISSRIRTIEREHVAMSENMRLIKDESHTKTEFLAKVSHEIRTPMNGMLGLVELIQATPLNKDQKRYINAIQNAGKGLLDVINDVLDFSRMEAGKLDLQDQPFQLQELLSDACSIYEFDARRKGVELGCIVAPGTPQTVIGDGSRIRQILLNTLSNALKYTERGFVHINVHLTDQIHNDKLVLRFEVEDSGVGIAAEDQRKLFQTYSQIGGARQAGSVGTGLGLAICQQLVQLMGGKMGVKSEVGAGSCFWFDVPLGLPDHVEIAEKPIVLDVFDGVMHTDEPAFDQPDSPAPPRAKANEAGGLRVLLVEDNEINKNVMVEFLRKMGLDPDLADNGRSAVEQAQERNEPYDLVLMDCEMPVMDGYEAASRIVRWQKSHRQRLTPIIALSAHAMDKHRALALEAGMVDYLTKPISYEQLYTKLSTYLELNSQ